MTILVTVIVTVVTVVITVTTPYPLVDGLPGVIGTAPSGLRLGLLVVSLLRLATLLEALKVRAVLMLRLLAEEMRGGRAVALLVLVGVIVLLKLTALSGTSGTLVTAGVVEIGRLARVGMEEVTA